ncbi:Valyl-tRNA synthetase [Helicobacter sp. NHP19-012]|uniref:Valyl-tRNA synthetase n=1 Tax=Helicobacter gastrofelis TaxID=2849642 RepID=A0ABN6I8P9_9HELI|nr:MULTISPECIES: DUF5718 family protein [unclassified Helicobacter]BCZ19851.1 Valyl-tRNA synthetase [Helicobacter sp. NHP19-012]GMB95523.1 Valyl-tRNA synthetase [Helicobacter sp. NHP22-001]
MQDFIGLGVVGNFAKHLEQAGEAHSFINMKHIEKDAPKGLFPFYLPNDPSYLGRDCMDNEVMVLPDDLSLRAQAEPEIALECEITYNDKHLVESITPHYFMAFNDGSIRNFPAKRLSAKKNFSRASKGMGAKLPIDRFVYGGVCNDFSIASFLTREGQTHVYGENSKLVKYEYFYDKLMDWIVEMLNTQRDTGVLEDLQEILRAHNYPSKLLIAIGATPYMPFAQEHFLQQGDTITIIVYNHRRYSFDKILEMTASNTLLQASLADTSIIQQKVLLENIN